MNVKLKLMEHQHQLNDPHHQFYQCPMEPSVICITSKVGEIYNISNIGSFNNIDKIGKIGNVCKIGNIGYIGNIGKIGNTVKIVKIGVITTFVFSTKFSEDAKRKYLRKS